MSKSFDPASFLLHAPSSSDLGIPETQVLIPRSEKALRFIPAFPISFLTQIAPAGDAVPVLLVAFALMRMKNETEISLGPALWAVVGKPNARIRARLLKQIASLPESLCILEPRQGRPHLLRASAQWRQKIESPFTARSRLSGGG